MKSKYSIMGRGLQAKNYHQNSSNLSYVSVIEYIIPLKWNLLGLTAPSRYLEQPTFQWLTLSHSSGSWYDSTSRLSRISKSTRPGPVKRCEPTGIGGRHQQIAVLDLASLSVLLSSVLVISLLFVMPDLMRTLLPVGSCLHVNALVFPLLPLPSRQCG